MMGICDGMSYYEMYALWINHGRPLSELNRALNGEPSSGPIWLEGTSESHPLNAKHDSVTLALSFKCDFMAPYV